MSNNLVVITDCDHHSISIEENFLRENGFDVRLENCESEEQVISKCRNAVALLNQYAPITEKVLSNLPNCKVIVRYGVGVDNIDIEAASKYQIQICNVPDYGVEEVSDHALSLMFTLVRKINLLNSNTKKGNWDFRISRPILRMNTLKLGVVGMGRIGQALAKKATGIGLHVMGFDRNKQKQVKNVEQVTFDYLIRNSDIVSIHLPLEKSTYHLFNSEVFKIMKKNAIIINTARGSIINEQELAEAIKNKDISGAGIDVLEVEPPQEDNPLLKEDNVIITPHAAWYSEEAAAELKYKAAKEIANVVRNNNPIYPINYL